MKKVLSCILSFLPAISFVIAITGLICFSVFVSEPLNAEQKMISFIMMLFAFFVVIITFAIMIWYMVKICKKPEVDIGVKVLWCFLLYMFNIFAFPVFWFVYIRKE